jgi:hypothetical protein
MFLILHNGSDEECSRNRFTDIFVSGNPYGGDDPLLWLEIGVSFVDVSISGKDRIINHFGESLIWLVLWFLFLYFDVCQNWWSGNGEIELMNYWFWGLMSCQLKLCYKSSPIVNDPHLHDGLCLEYIVPGGRLPDIKVYVVLHVINSC